MKTLFSFLGFFFFSTFLFAQDLTLDVWANGAPDDNGLTGPEEILENNRVRNISVAKMYVYLPEQSINTGAAVILLPGGGYRREAMSHEGYEVAEWLKSKGITGIVLKYRLPNGHPWIPSEDARRAIQVTRQHAKEWGVNPEKVGLGGASAGGHLASTVGTKFGYGDEESADPVAKFSSRPDFLLLLYPVIYFKEEMANSNRLNNFFGEDKSWETIKQYSSERNVTKDTPPAFFVLADNDPSVDPRHSVQFYLAMKEFKIPAEMHIFHDGGHGFGITKKGLPSDQWPDLFYDWLKSTKVVED